MNSKYILIKKLFNPFNLGVMLLTLLLMLVLSFAQSKKAIKEETERVESELQELQEKYEKEKQFFNRYQGQKEKLISQKKSEKKEVETAIKKLNRDLRRAKYQSTRLEQWITSSKEINREYLELLAEVVVDLRESILSGIPFEKERRASILTAIILDIENGNSSGLEILNRLIAFLDAEDVHSYDSQVFPATVELEGKKVNANVLRLGRVFFAVDTTREVYLYRYQEGKFVIGENPVSVQDKIEIQKAIRIIEGKKAPELVRLPIPTERVMRGNNENNNKTIDKGETQ